MFREKRPTQRTLFIPGTLSTTSRQDHILKKVNAVLDLKWLNAEVKDLYSHTTGRPCIEPERAVRLMLAGFFHGIVHDRKLCARPQGTSPFDGSPATISPRNFPITAAHQHQEEVGAEKFRLVFEKERGSCAKAGLVDGDLLHIDASLVRGNVSWKSMVRKHVEP